MQFLETANNDTTKYRSLAALGATTVKSALVKNLAVSSGLVAVATGTSFEKREESIIVDIKTVFSV